MQLTDKQKEDCQKIIDDMVNYFWHKIKIKMDIDGLSFEEASEEIRQEILQESVK